MRIPLIVAGTEAREYPFVYLRAGKWSIETDAQSSVVTIESPPLPAQDHIGLVLDLATRTAIRACVTFRGTERNITVYACLIP